MRGEWPSPAQGGVAVMTPAGGDRFLGRGELDVLARTHDKTHASSRLGDASIEDLCHVHHRWKDCNDLSLEKIGHKAQSYFLFF